MRSIVQVLAALILLTGSMSCKKGADSMTDKCNSGSTTIRQISNRPATVKVTGTIYETYLVEDGSIDTKLIPCSLPIQFVKNNLLVIVSGDVKTRAGTQNEPCCAENLLITNIVTR